MWRFHQRPYRSASQPIPIRLSVRTVNSISVNLSFGAEKMKRPPGASTRAASRTTASTSGICSITQLLTTVRKGAITVGQGRAARHLGAPIDAAPAGFGHDFLCDIDADVNAAGKRQRREIPIAAADVQHRPFQRLHCEKPVLHRPDQRPMHGSKARCWAKTSGMSSVRDERFGKEAYLLRELDRATFASPEIAFHVSTVWIRPKIRMMSS